VPQFSKHILSSIVNAIMSSGSKVFAANQNVSVSYKFVSMILACTGGGILVPIFLNSIPVPMANDAYPIAIATSFAIHHYFPIVGEVVKLSPMVHVCSTCCFFRTIGLSKELINTRFIILHLHTSGNDHCTL
jgi:uncharacterized membrane protein YeiH